MISLCIELHFERKIGNRKIDLGGDSPVFEVNNRNFRQMLDLEFSETSQNFCSFRLLFISGPPLETIPRGDQRKNAEKLPKLCMDFEFFFPLDPYWKL
jgi:hypothetical protein